MGRVIDIKSKAYKKEYNMQAREHPTVPRKWLKVVVKDHLKIAARKGKHGG